MTNIASTTHRGSSFGPIAIYNSVLQYANAIPLSLIQLASRVAIAKVFWDSSQSKLASWPVTQQLFAMEYHVPLLPPDVAAVLATATELCGSIVIFLGLLTRLGAVALLGVVATIQLFVFPGSWGEHLLWASLLLLLVARGAGKISLDEIARRLLMRKG